MFGGSFGQFGIEALLNGLQEVHGVEVHVGLDVLDAVNTAGQVLRHLAGVYGINTGLLQGCAEPAAEGSTGLSRSTSVQIMLIIA